MRMRAAVFYGPKQSLLVEEIELDPPREGEVLVKLVATGVCHSDVHYYAGDAILPSGRPGSDAGQANRERVSRHAQSPHCHP